MIKIYIIQKYKKMFINVYKSNEQVKEEINKLSR